MYKCNVPMLLLMLQYDCQSPNQAILVKLLIACYQSVASC